MINSTEKTARNNFYSFLWHAAFLALAQNFMDVDTIIPAMLYEAGGNAFHIGLMTAIMVGGSSFTQLFFAPYISNKPFKKKFLLVGINSRVLSLIALGAILFYLNQKYSSAILLFIFFFIAVFSLSGAFANISYIDIIGKVIDPEKRKKLFSSRQIISGLAVFASAFLAKELITKNDFPVNYASSFFIGGLLLLIASGGFWKIKEKTKSGIKIKGTREFLNILKSELKQ
ncbi:MAG: MFS transporter, partial [Bacteroidales bacterium]|nr:MFS transporter [Bacteroidales bacterium]